jgi:hypothetical protein
MRKRGAVHFPLCVCRSVNPQLAGVLKSQDRYKTHIVAGFFAAQMTYFHADIGQQTKKGVQKKWVLSFQSCFSHCGTDYIAVYEGSSSSGPLKTTICGNRKEELNFTGPNLLLEFRSVTFWGCFLQSLSHVFLFALFWEQENSHNSLFVWVLNINKENTLIKLCVTFLLIQKYTLNVLWHYFLILKSTL